MVTPKHSITKHFTNRLVTKKGIGAIVPYIGKSESLVCDSCIDAAVDYWKSVNIDLFRAGEILSGDEAKTLCATEADLPEHECEYVERTGMGILQDSDLTMLKPAPCECACH